LNPNPNLYLVKRKRVLPAPLAKNPPENQVEILAVKVTHSLFRRGGRKERRKVA